jgi:hypothetical protein
MSQKKKVGKGKDTEKKKVVSFLQETGLSSLSTDSSSSSQLPPLFTESSSFTFVDDKGTQVGTATQVQLEDEMSLETNDSVVSLVMALETDDSVVSPVMASSKMIVDHHSSKPEMSLVRLHNFLETAEVKKRM